MNAPDRAEVSVKPQFRWDDPLLLDEQLSEDERMVRETARALRAGRAACRASSRRSATRRRTPSMFPRWARWACSGRRSRRSYGGAGLNYVCYGLIAREIERVDSGYRSMMSVQSSLVMFPILTYGSEAQRRKYLPKLATRRMDRLLRPDRAQPRLRPGLR